MCIYTHLLTYEFRSENQKLLHVVQRYNNYINDTENVNKINSGYISWLDFDRRNLIFIKIQPQDMFT